MKVAGPVPPLSVVSVARDNRSLVEFKSCERARDRVEPQTRYRFPNTKALRSGLWHAHLHSKTDERINYLHA